MPARRGGPKWLWASRKRIAGNRIPAKSATHWSESIARSNPGEYFPHRQSDWSSPNRDPAPAARLILTGQPTSARRRGFGLRGGFDIKVPLFCDEIELRR